MSIVNENVTSDHFPICFQCNKHVVDMYKTLLDRVPLKLNSSLLFHSLFDAYMKQMFAMFLEQVTSKRMVCMRYNITKHQVQILHNVLNVQMATYYA